MHPFFYGLLVFSVFSSSHAQDGCTAPATLSGNSTFGSADPYSNYQKCRWVINGQAGKALELTFPGRFDIEQSTGCNYDKVVIYNSDAVDNVLKNAVCSATSLAQLDKFGPYCGFSAPSEPIISSGNRVVVEFCSDSSSTGRGFQLTSKEVAGNPAPSSGSDCNIDVIVDKSHIVTFYNAAGYPSFTKCNYKFTSKNGKTLKVNANRFNLEGYLGCRYDSLKIIDNGNVVGTYCGTNGPKNVRSSGSSLQLQFSSDQYTNGKGFSLTIEESCQGSHLCSKNDNAQEDQCYNDRQICDGTNNCMNGADESFCEDCGSATWSVGKPFPGAAAITHIDGQIHCGGALISNRYVLTSAHCFHRLDDKPNRFVVKLGGARLSDMYVSQIESVTIHNLFNPKTLANNLAIIKLAKTVPLQDTIAPFCIPSTSANGVPAAGAQCYTLGWGRTAAQDINSYSPSVKNLTASIVANSQCKWSASPVVVDDKNICASTSGKLCYGDNGAPLICKATNGKWQLVGVNSVAFGCTATTATPASFTKVYSYATWINDIVFV